MSGHSQSLQQHVDRQKRDAQRRFSSWFVHKFKKSDPQPLLREQDEATLQRERSERLRKQPLTAVTTLRAQTSGEYSSDMSAEDSRSATLRQQSFLRSQLKEMKRLSHEAILRHRRSVQEMEGESNQEQDQQAIKRQPSGDSDEDGDEEVKAVHGDEDDEELLGSAGVAASKPPEKAADDTETSADISDLAASPDAVETPAADASPSDNQKEEEDVAVALEISKTPVEEPERVEEPATTETTPSPADKPPHMVAHMSMPPMRQNSGGDSRPVAPRRSSLDSNDNGRTRRSSVPDDIERRMAQAQLLFEEAMLLAEQALHVETTSPTPVRAPVLHRPTPPKPTQKPVQQPIEKLVKPSIVTRTRRAHTTTAPKEVFAQPDNEWI